MESRLRQAIVEREKADNAVFQENAAYSVSGAQNLSLQSQIRAQGHSPSMTSTRSTSPATDQSAPQTRSNPIAIARRPPEKKEDPDELDSEDSDDDSALDIVERDAIRLRKKYGSSVITHPATQEDASSILSKSMLKAPYLGSMSKSEGYLSSLPPISLSGPAASYDYDEDPPTEITSYGSLRESHQRGKFFDGPSSYREPRSGQIRRFDHNLGVREYSQSLQPTVSIGERIQQNHRKATANLKGKADEGTSGLSMMFGQESTDPTPKDREEGSEHMEPIKHASSSDHGHAPHHLSAFDGEQQVGNDILDPPAMLSSSLTAFEILHSTSYQRNHTHRFVEQRNLLPSDAEIREQHFQPLGRSISDPTPHHLQSAPLFSPTLEPLNSPQGGNVSVLWSSHRLAQPNSTPEYGASPYYTPATGQLAASTTNGSTMDNVVTGVVLPASAFSNLVLASATATETGQNHNPDTDAAFDMDME